MRLFYALAAGLLLSSPSVAKYNRPVKIDQPTAPHKMMFDTPRDEIVLVPLSANLMGMMPEPVASDGLRVMLIFNPQWISPSIIEEIYKIKTIENKLKININNDIFDLFKKKQKNENMTENMNVMKYIILKAASKEAIKELDGCLKNNKRLSIDIVLNDIRFVNVFDKASGQKKASHLKKIKWIIDCDMRLKHLAKDQWLGPTLGDDARASSSPSMMDDAGHINPLNVLDRVNIILGNPGNELASRKFGPKLSLFLSRYKQALQKLTQQNTQMLDKMKFKVSDIKISDTKKPAKRRVGSDVFDLGGLRLNMDLALSPAG